MQKKIESFFKHSFTPPSTNFDDIFNGIRAQKTPEIRIKYTRQSIRVAKSTNDELIGEENCEEKSEELKGKILNKKRKYAQFHLELGQSDFLLHSCKICGMKYTKGNETDEKIHTTFHKNFTHGIPFKGWKQEKVVDLPSLGRDRVIVVSEWDTPAQRKKVQEVVKMMEIELGDGWIFHDHCQVYLFISSQRVPGCMIVEPIKEAHKLVSDLVLKNSEDACGKKVISKPNILQFGTICFRRELSRKGSTHRSSEAMDSNLLESIVCEEKATLASCGIRAVWVSPSNRRKGIATRLLDALRKSFTANYVLEHSQLAFCNPTSAGKALATNYTGTGSFLVYGS